MRAEELVRRAEEDVDAESRHVDRRVGGVVHRVRPRERACVVRELDDACSVRRCAERVRRERERDDPGALRQLPLKVFEVEGCVLADLDKVDPDVEVMRELEPRGDVPVVVEARDEDLVSRLERPPERAGQGEVERRHVLAEDRLLGAAAEEARGGRMGLLDQFVAAATGGEGAAEVRVRLPQIVADRVDHGLRALRSTGRVEEGDTRAERRESRPDRLEVEGHPRSSGAIVSPRSRSCSQ